MIFIFGFMCGLCTGAVVVLMITLSGDIGRTQADLNGHERTQTDANGPDV